MRRLLPGARRPSAGSPRVRVPPLRRCHAGALTAVVPSAGLVVPRLAVPSPASVFRSLRAGRAPSGPGLRKPGLPVPVRLGTETGSASQVPWQPSGASAPFSDPAVASAHGVRASVLLPTIGRRQPIGTNLSGLNGAAFALPVYASQGGSPRPHARLGSGCCQLCRVGFGPTGLL